MNIKEFLLTLDIKELYDELCRVFENSSQIVTAGRTQFFTGLLKRSKPSSPYSRRA